MLHQATYSNSRQNDGKVWVSRGIVVRSFSPGLHSGVNLGGGGRFSGATNWNHWFYSVGRCGATRAKRARTMAERAEAGSR